MMSSPFPHVHARAAAEKEKMMNANAKKNIAWDLFWSSCWRTGFLIALMLVATIAYLSWYSKPDERPHWPNLMDPMVRTSQVRHESVESVNQPSASELGGRFFIDIMTSLDDLKSRLGGSLVEKKGWNGVCVAPPGDFTGRSCRLIAFPIGPVSGQEIEFSDCSRSLLSAPGLYNMVSKFTQALPGLASEGNRGVSRESAMQRLSEDGSSCPQIITKTVSITEVLSMAAAPKVIDFISLETHGTELDIINTFPFAEHCVRAWSIMGHKEDAIHGITQLLEVSQGCRVKVSGQNVFARCPCDQSNRMQPTKAVATMEILPSGAQHMVRKGASQE